MGDTFLYARVSTLDQNTDLQTAALRAAYPLAPLRQEKKSGTQMGDREMLKLLLEMVGSGDKIVVWKLDRLARNIGDLSLIIKKLEEKGATLEILDQKIDTGTATGRAFLMMLGVFAEFETNLRRERQIAGIAAAQARGTKFGRRPTMTDDQKEEARCRHYSGETPSELAVAFGVSRGTIYNAIKEDKQFSEG